jgi:hypothetical protein
MWNKHMFIIIGWQNFNSYECGALVKDMVSHPCGGEELKSLYMWPICMHRALT